VNQSGAAESRRLMTSATDVSPVPLKKNKRAEKNEKME
jgi:hypothetical protein